MYRDVHPGTVWRVEATRERDVSDSGDGLQEGQKIQNFELPDGEGGLFGLHERLREGPLVLVFYRGDW